MPNHLTVITLLSLALLASCTTYPESTNITNKDPNYPFKGEMYTGFIVVDNQTQSNLYYHLYAHNQGSLTDDAPLIIWFQGGPGCASSFGNYNELGPVYVLNGTTNNTYSFVRNNNTWNNWAHLMFIDQPTGTGFSVSNGLNISTTEQASKNVQVFLARFYQLYPALAKHKLYLFGESYAGKYVPTFAHDLLNNATFLSQIQFAGIGVGDGWSDPVYQVSTYGTFGYVTGLVDGKTRDSLNRHEKKAEEDVANSDWTDADNESNTISNILYNDNVNAYDYRIYGSPATYYNLWLNTPQAQSFLGIPATVYDDCNSDVSDDMVDDNMQSIAGFYPGLISKIPVLFYVGQDDDNCGYEGVANYVSHLDWSDLDNFQNSERVPWKLDDGSTAGLAKAYGNFTFVTIFKAGHMVPTYQPEAAGQMVRDYLAGTPFTPAQKAKKVEM